MPVRLNFAGVETKGTFAPWPVDEDINFTIFNVTQAKGKESKEPYLSFEFKQVDGNRRTWSNFSLQPQALWRLKKLLVDLGDHDEEELQGDMELNLDDLLGKEVVIKFGPVNQNSSGNDTQDIKSIVAA